MEIVAVVTLVALVFVIRWAWRTHRKYLRLFSDAHLMEVIRLVPLLKEAALSRVGKPLQDPEDPRIVFTSLGVTMFYTIEAPEDESLHHFSFSHGGGPLAFAAGGRFLYVTLTVLGILGKLKGVAHSRGGVTHGICQMPRGDLSDYANKSIDRQRDWNVPRLKDAATDWLVSFREANQLLTSEEDLLAKLHAT